MSLHRIIQNLFPVAMLLLFALSITPRKYLHDAFAHHKDSTSLYAKHKGTSIEQKGFQCDQHNLVADQPMVPHELLNCAYPLPLVNDFQQSNYHSFIKLFLADLSLRGPPAA